MPEPMPAEAATIVIDDANRPTPLLVRVLEWINVPLLGWPDAVREAMGKVAILTLLNAVAVLLYVLWLRRR